VTADAVELLGALRLTNAQRLAEIDRLEAEVAAEEARIQSGTAARDDGDDQNEAPRAKAPRAKAPRAKAPRPKEIAMLRALRFSSGITAGEQVQASSSKHIPIKRSQAEDVWETLHLIVLGLARGNGSLKKRLINVLLSYAQHIGSDSFPPQLREQWKKVEDVMNRKPSERTSIYLSAEDELNRMSYELGSIPWSVKAMGRKEPKVIAEIFVSLYDSVCRELGPERD